MKTPIIACSKRTLIDIWRHSTKVLRHKFHENEPERCVPTVKQFELEDRIKKKVDLINLRCVPTTLQKEVIAAERRIYPTGSKHRDDEYAADKFEMLTLSYYQKLNQERAEIIKDALANGRFIV